MQLTYAIFLLENWYNIIMLFSSLLVRSTGVMTFGKLELQVTFVQRVFRWLFIYIFLMLLVAVYFDKVVR